MRDTLVLVAAAPLDGVEQEEEETDEGAVAEEGAEGEEEEETEEEGVGAEKEVEGEEVEGLDEEEEFG